MQDVAGTENTASEWEKVRPVLDAAMSELGERDRDALVLRFFDNRPFAEIGARLGLAENSARMRVDRALDKLHALLARRGIRSTTSALGAVLAQEALAGAPAGLAASVAGSALATAGAAAPALTFLQLMSTSKIAVGGAAALLLALGTAGYYAYRHTETGRQPERHALAASAASARAARSAASDTDRAGGAATGPVGAQSATPASADEMKRETTAALVEPNPAERAVRIAAILQKLSRSNWRGIEAAFLDERKLHGRGNVPEWMLVMRRAGEVVGREAVEVLMASERLLAAKEALSGWASKDPVAALEWLGKDASSETRRQIMGAAIRGLLLAEPDLAISALEGIPADRRQNYTNDFASGLVQSVGLEKAETFIHGMLVRSMSAGTLDNDGAKRVWSDFAEIKLQTAQAKHDMEEAIRWLTPQLGKPYVDQTVVVSAVEKYASAAPEKAAAWLQGVNDARLAARQDTIGYRVLLSTWLENAGAPAVSQWLQAQAAHPQYDRIAGAYTAVLAAQNPAEAARWAGTIKDPATRAAAQAALKAPAKGG